MLSQVLPVPRGLKYNRRPDDTHLFGRCRNIGGVDHGYRYDIDSLEEVNLFFDQAAERLGLAEGRREMLRGPWRELQVQVPVRMDDGHINV